MAEAEIAKLYANLSVADEDSEIHERTEEDQSEGEVEVELCLVGKILSSKKVNREAFIHMIDQLWSPFGKVGIQSVGINIFIFQFNNQEEKNRIWQRGPWYYDKSLIVLEKPEGMGNISQLRFNKVEVWIQIHDVPISCMNRRSAMWMAEQIGRVIDIPTESKDCWGKFMKVKVQIDISKPLKRWLRLKLGKSNDIVMVSLKYERLPEFCYVCGRIGHASKECSDEKAKIEGLKGLSNKFGSWMRASAPDRQNMRFDQKIGGKGKEVDLQKLSDDNLRSGENEGGLQKSSAGLVISQVENLTDSERDPKEANFFSVSNILAKDNGSGSTQGLGSLLEGPMVKVRWKKKVLGQNS